MSEDQRLDKLTEMVDNMIFIGDSPKEIADMCIQMTKQWSFNDENKIKAEAVLTYLSSAEIPENAKSGMVGEFVISHTETCSGCYYDEPDEECEVCGGEVEYQVSIEVPWTMQKDIFKKFIECARVEYASKLERGEL